MPTQISDATKDVLNKLKNVMGDPTATKKLKIEPELNKDDGKILNLHSEAPDNINDEIIEDSIASTAKISESLETQEPDLVPEFGHENDSPKSSQDDIDENHSESIDIKNTDVNDVILHDHQDDTDSDTIERNWQTAVQDELKDVIQFNDTEDELIDLDQGFGIDKINNVKPVMDLESDKNINLQKNLSEQKRITEEEQQQQADIIEKYQEDLIDENDLAIDKNDLSDENLIIEDHPTIEEFSPTATPSDFTDFQDPSDVIKNSSLPEFQASTDIEDNETLINSNPDLNNLDNFTSSFDHDISLSEKDDPISDSNLDEGKESYFDAYDFDKAALEIDKNIPNFNKIENYKNEQIGSDMQNSSNKVMSDKTYNRARNIIDSFRTQINDNNKSEPETKAVKNNSLEDLVGSLIKPMLKDWLDQNLSSIVEEVVTKEVKKLTDK